MKSILIVDKVNLQIKSRYMAEAPNQASYGGPWGDASSHAHIEVPQELEASVAYVKVTMSSGNMEVVIDPVLVEEAKEAAWALLRKERDAKLAACDFTQIADAPLSNTQKVAWAGYRQDLRQLPENIENPLDFEWPQVPVDEEESEE